MKFPFLKSWIAALLLITLTYCPPSHAIVGLAAGDSLLALEGLFATVTGPNLIADGIKNVNVATIGFGLICTVVCLPVGIVILDDKGGAPQLAALNLDMAKKHEITLEELESFNGELPELNALLEESHSVSLLDQSEFWKQSILGFAPQTIAAIKKLITIGL